MPRRDPFRDIEELFERMGREFEELGGTFETPLSSKVAIDVFEDAETVRVTADLPGYTRDDIDVELREDTLTIAATRSESFESGSPDPTPEAEIETDSDAEAEGEEEAEVEANDKPATTAPDRHYHVRERKTQSVSRRIQLPASVEQEGASATHTNGVLTVTLRKEAARDDEGHRIDVN